MTLTFNALKTKFVDGVYIRKNAKGEIVLSHYSSPDKFTTTDLNEAERIAKKLLRQYRAR